MKIKIRTKRIIVGMLALFMLFGSIPFNSISVQAATGNVKVDSLGKKGSVSYGSKTKSGTWFQMKVAGKFEFPHFFQKLNHLQNKKAKTLH